MCVAIVHATESIDIVARRSFFRSLAISKEILQKFDFLLGLTAFDHAIGIAEPPAKNCENCLTLYASRSEDTKINLDFSRIQDFVSFSTFHFPGL